MQSENLPSISKKILLATGDGEWGLDTRVKLASHGFDCQLAREGKECQLTVYKDKFSVVLLDPDIKNHSGLEVLKFLKLNHPAMKVILIFPDQKRSSDYGELQKNLNRVGVSKSFIRPFNIKQMVDYLNDLSPAQSWKQVAFKDGNFPEEADAKILDRDCTRVDLESFLNGNLAIFDYYIRLKENHFVKIIKRGEDIEPGRVLKYAKEKVKHFYFLTKERRNYINYMNEVMKSTVSSSTTKSEVILSQMKNVSEKFMEEIHTRGLKPDLVEESKAISENMYNFLRTKESLRDILGQFENFYPEKFSHSFLTSFFAAVICKNLKWVGPRTLESVALGACLHDIGIIKLPASIRDKEPSTLSAKEMEIYKTHPRLGADMLGLLPDVNPQVVQIVYQHHERCDGAGYPNQLTNVKIYPLAKIVSLADAFAEILTEKKLPPLEGLKLLLQDRNQLLSFDPTIVRALVSCFIKEELKP